jgi:glycosyltransferase involved in cell wall biosynthesis
VVHVLHVIEATIGGTRRHVVDACRGLARRGVRVSLVASALRETRFREDLRELASDGVEIREIPMVRAIRPATDLSQTLQLRQILRELRPDIVHTHSSKAGAIGRLASWSSGVGARVHTPHTFAFLFGAMFSPTSRSLFRAVEKELARKTDRFLAVSDDEASTFRSAGFIPEQKLRVVPNGVNPAPFDAAKPLERADLKVPSGAPLLLAVGLLNVAKGQDLAIAALASEALKDAYLLLAGSGETESELRALAEKLGVSARVRFLGWRDDVPRLLKTADFLLLPSRWEGMPYIVLEAMSASLPVVATRVDGARAVIEASGGGALSEEVSAESLAAALAPLLALDSTRRRQIGERGAAAVRGHYTLDHMIDGLLRVYGEVT